VAAHAASSIINGSTASTATGVRKEDGNTIVKDMCRQFVRRIFSEIDDCNSKNGSTAITLSSTETSLSVFEGAQLSVNEALAYVEQHPEVGDVHTLFGRSMVQVGLKSKQKREQEEALKQQQKEKEKLDIKKKIAQYKNTPAKNAPTKNGMQSDTGHSPAGTSPKSSRHAHQAQTPGQYKNQLLTKLDGMDDTERLRWVRKESEYWESRSPCAAGDGDAKTDSNANSRNRNRSFHSDSVTPATPHKHMLLKDREFRQERHKRRALHARIQAKPLTD